MKKIIPILLVCVLCLTGCSSSVSPTDDITVKWDNGVITVAGNTINFSSYKGYEATIEGGNGGLDYNFMLDAANDVTSITVNTQGILEENMDTYKGKFYYAEYLGSKVTMAEQVGDATWAVCQVVTGGLPTATVAAYISDYMDKVALTNGQVYVDFGDFIFGTDYDTVEVRPDCALISGVAKVSQGTYNTTSTVSVIQDEKEYQLQKGSSSRYDYYVYGSYLIQISAGLDVSNYITFK